MAPIWILLMFLLAVTVLAGVVAIGAVVLVKLGVIAHYAVKKEAPEQGEYRLDQSHEVDKTAF
jgi:ABC-type protease/lipase transport system fused ATPase/permease subunit